MGQNFRSTDMFYDVKYYAVPRDADEERLEMVTGEEENRTTVA